MSAWPTGIRQPDVGFGEETLLPQIKNEFESGHVQSRAKSTVQKERWTLPFTLLPPAEYALLRAHFIANQGTVFDWTHPISAVTYQVRYTGNSIKSTVSKRDLRSVTVELEEAP